ncbi:hypothetical protein DVA86_29395 [Streptomyces armeniacus]|uniref:Secreted protein n=1 Tax=Streptomyces armeniacus TaxID=83291 RepID=A0A345XWT2_9ACTN|nr:hypothetical protein [Streptomyces armeniacus]AXK36098.1 hypothetical protein DVA86_29395 [Streptomyces armeniacus]
MSKIRMGLVGAAALGTTVFVLPAGSTQAQPAQAAVCRGETIKIDGGKLEYGECSQNGMREVKGTLNDTKGNGRCVYAKVVFKPSGETRDYKDCGGEVTKITTGWEKASDAEVTLR